MDLWLRDGDVEKDVFGENHCYTAALCNNKLACIGLGYGIT